MQNTEIKRRPERILSEKAQIKVAMIYSFIQYVFIGAFVLLTVVTITGYFVNIPTNLGMIGLPNIETVPLSMISGGILGGLIAKALSYK